MKVEAEDHGTIWLLRPVDDEARAWMEEHVDQEAVTCGDAYVVEHRYVTPILEGMYEAAKEATE